MAQQFHARSSRRSCEPGFGAHRGRRDCGDTSGAGRQRRDRRRRTVADAGFRRSARRHDRTRDRAAAECHDADRLRHSRARQEARGSRRDDGLCGDFLRDRERLRPCALAGDDERRHRRDQPPQATICWSIIASMPATRSPIWEPRPPSKRSSKPVKSTWFR